MTDLITNLPDLIEGKANFKVGKAFYRPQSHIARDLGVLAATVYQQNQGKLRVLDAMSGCGVRSLRYWLEAKADWIWANEANTEISPILQANLASIIPNSNYQLTSKNANQIFFDCYNRRDYYDLIDLDCFGSAAPYLSTSLWAAKIGGLLYLTSTDGRSATGHLPEKSLAVYGAYARAHPAAQEQALRLIIGSLQQQAATKDLGIEPIFAFFSGQTYRVMVRLIKHNCLNVNNYGFLGYCHQCGEYQVVTWHNLGKAVCGCQQGNLTISGPIWLGNLHNREYLVQMRAIALQSNWLKLESLLDLMLSEIDFPPYFYTLREIGHRGNLNLPKITQLITALQQQGYRASLTHINPQAIKTNADLATCIKIINATNN